MLRNKMFYIVKWVFAGILFTGLIACDGENGGLTDVRLPDPTRQEFAGMSAEDDMSAKTDEVRAKAAARASTLQGWTGVSNPGLVKRDQARHALWVRPGESIQDAVDAAAPGSFILIHPGMYAETIEITTPNLTLIGMLGTNGEKVIIQNPGTLANGFCVMPPPGQSYLQGFTLYNVTVRGFEENGVFLEYTHDFFIGQTTTIDNGEYGVYPVHSIDGTVYRCSAHGHADTGLYIGQSKRVWLLDNLATDNVIGIEIENCSSVVAVDNISKRNTAGIMAVLLPPSEHITDTFSEHIWILWNGVHDNNLDNFADPADLAAFVPKGSGILIVGMNETTVAQNVVTRNNFVGIGTASTLLFGSLAGLPAEAFAGIEPNPDSVNVQFNMVVNNGTNPPVLPAPLTGLGADLFWDESGLHNCWRGNRYATSIPEYLPQCVPL